MSEAVASAAMAGYRIVGFTAIPLLPLFLRLRAARGREDLSRSGEREGRASLARPAGPLSWVHAASVGESNAVLPLVRRLAEAGQSVLMTTATTSAAGLLAGKLPRGAVHQFSPIDIAPFVGRFLDHWRPDLALFVESELWPVRIDRLAKAGIPRILVNARLSDRSFRRWRSLGRVARPFFEPFTLCLAQSTTDAERYRSLGIRDVRVTGNLKFDAPPLPVDPAALDAFSRALGGRPFWLAASTHEGEEAIAAEVHASLAARFPGLLTIIAPRHPQRGEAISDMLAARGLKVARRGTGEAPAPDTDVYLADTLGELGLFYRLAPVAFLGGSLIRHGGQNPIEAVRLGTLVLHGPHTGNFAEIYRDLDGSERAERVEDAGGLASALARCLDDPAVAARRMAGAEAELELHSGALEATFAAIAPYLKEPAGP